MRLAVLFVLLVFATAYAEDYVAVNSMDGRDVLSGIFYANAKGEPVKFMPVPGGDSDTFATKIGTGHSVLLIQSNTPVSGFVANALTANNNTVEVYTSTDAGATNLDLVKRSGADSFIIVDSAYSDSALSVLPYAKYTHSYVIMADKTNIDQVKAMVAGKKITIYGLVDKEVSDALAPYSPTIIGTGEDQFADNLAINALLMNQSGIKNVIITDGTAMEDSLAAGDQPIILIGSLVPQPTYDFIKQKVRNGQLVQVMLVGNQLVVPVYDMRERIKNELAGEGSAVTTFAIIVKFAQVIPSAGSGVQVLDTFHMPAYQPLLNVSGIVYNQQSGTVMATVGNPGDGAAYFTSEVRVRVDGADFKVFTSNETKIVERGDAAGFQYPVDLSSITEGNVTALVLVKYGLSKNSLDSFISQEGPLETISYVDTTNISVQFAKYDSDNKRLLVTLRNNGGQQAYVSSIVGLLMGGQPTNVTGAGTLSVNPSSLAVEEFPLELSGADLSANNNVSVFINYGGRPGFLVKHSQYSVPLQNTANPLIFLILPIAIIVVLLAAAYFLFVRKPAKEPEGEAEEPKKAKPEKEAETEAPKKTKPVKEPAKKK
jgi:hypothetical protein